MMWSPSSRRPFPGAETAGLQERPRGSLDEGGAESTAAITASAPIEPIDPAPDRERIEGTVTGISEEAPARGALAVLWLALVSGSSSILDARGLVLWPGTSIVIWTRGWSRPGDLSDLTPLAHVRAWARGEEYYTIPVTYDARWIEILARR